MPYPSAYGAEPRHDDGANVAVLLAASQDEASSVIRGLALIASFARNDGIIDDFVERADDTLSTRPMGVVIIPSLRKRNQKSRSEASAR